MEKITTYPGQGRQDRINWENGLRHTEDEITIPYLRHAMSDRVHKSQFKLTPAAD